MFVRRDPTGSLVWSAFSHLTKENLTLDDLCWRSFILLRWSSFVPPARPAPAAWIAETHEPTPRGMAMSIALVGTGAGAMSGASLAGLLAPTLGNAALFHLPRILPHPTPRSQLGPLMGSSEKAQAATRCQTPPPHPSSYFPPPKP